MSFSLTIKTAKQLRADEVAAAAQAAAAKARRLLAETDWYVTRLTETGKDIPPEVSAAREAARKAISKAP